MMRWIVRQRYGCLRYQGQTGGANKEVVESIGGLGDKGSIGSLDVVVSFIVYLIICCGAYRVDTISMTSACGLLQ